MYYKRPSFYTVFNKIFNQPENERMAIMQMDSLFRTKDYNHKDYQVISNKDGDYIILEVPGYNKSNLKIDFEDGVIKIEGQRDLKLKSEYVKRTYFRQFALNGSNPRQLEGTFDNIPLTRIMCQSDGSNVEQMEATLEDGILTLFIPKQKKNKSSKIKIL